MNKFILALMCILLLPAVLAANPGHTAASISPGTFNTGGAFTFPEQVSIQGNFIVDTNTLYVDSGTGRVGVGTNTPAATLDVNGNITLASGAVINQFSTDGTLAGNSNSNVPTEQAVKTYVDTEIGSIDGGPTGSGIAGQVTYWTGTDSQSGSNNLFWDTTNNRLGIGTNTPNTRLDVADTFRIKGTTTDPTYPTTGAGFEFAYDTDASATLSSGGLGAAIFQSYDRDATAWRDVRFRASQTAFDANGVTALFIQNDTNIGVGTNSPAATLDVNGNLILQSGAAINEFSVDPDLGTSDSKVPTQAAVKSYVDTAVGGAGGNITGSGSAGQVSYWTNTDTISGNNNFYWDPGTNRLGIGTTNPEYSLDVTGDFQLVAPDMDMYTGSHTLNLDMREDSGRSQYPYIAWRNNGTRGMYLGWGQKADHLLLRLEDNNDLGITGGNVGIGTTNPSTTLDVDGTTTTAGLTSTGNIDIGNNYYTLQGAEGSTYELRAGQNVAEGVAIRATSNPTNNIFAVESSGSATRFGVTQGSGVWARDGFYVGTADDGVGVSSLNEVWHEGNVNGGTGISVSGTTITNTDPHVGTNLGITGSGNSRTITSSTGSNVAIPTATTSNAGFMSTGDKQAVQASNLYQSSITTTSRTDGSVPASGWQAYSSTEGGIVGAVGNDNAFVFGLDRASGSSPSSVWVDWTWAADWQGPVELWHKQDFSSTDISNWNSAYAQRGSQIAGSGLSWDGSNLNADLSGSGSSGRVAFWTGSATQSSDANLFWDNSNNRLGIGTASPDRPLHIVQDPYPTLVLERPANDANERKKYITTSEVGISIGSFDDDFTPHPSIIINHDGHVGIGMTPDGTRALMLPDISGTAGRARANAWTTYSSIRLKEDVDTIDGKHAIDTVMNLNPVSFNWKEGHYEEEYNKKAIGFIAEEVGKIIPEAVEWDDEGIYAEELNTDPIISYLTKAIQEQQVIIDQQQALIDSQSEQLESIKDDLCALGVESRC